MAPVKSSKSFAHFIGEYISEQNNILFNGEKGISSNLKNLLIKCMNNNAKRIIFSKNNQLYYKFKYQIKTCHPVLNYFENNYNIFEANSQNIFSLKMQMENFLKSNKIKICDDFKGMKSTDLIKEYLKRMDNFDEVWNSITGIFTAIFKNYFISTKKIIKLCSTSDLFSNKNEKLIKPSTAQVNSSKINNIPISKSNTLSMKNDTKKIETELYLKNNENVNEIIETHSRRKAHISSEESLLKINVKIKNLLK